VLAEDLEGERRRVFPRRLGGKSPKRVFLLRVLVTRNVGCRNGFEASRRCVQGKPQGPTRRHRPATGRRRARTGPIVILFAKRCDGAQRSKGQCEPPIETPANRGPLIEPRRLVPQLLIESVEGAWGLDTGER